MVFHTINTEWTEERRGQGYREMAFASKYLFGQQVIQVGDENGKKKKKNTVSISLIYKPHSTHIQ